MGWTLHRWTWVLEGPLFVGFVPSGSLNRCRIYVPARAVWGAATAEAARHAARGAPDYKGVGDTLKRDARFSYLYPAERLSDRWIAWLPGYENGLGLCWQREDGRGEPLPDRSFRRRLLTTRPGTAIDPSSDSAADGSLRETECVSDRWRGATGGEDARVAYVGYVFTRTDAAKGYTASVDRLFLGGDTRYGLGRVRREEFELAKAGNVFGAQATLDADDPQVAAARVLAHTQVASEKPTIIGALELIGGWDYQSRRALNEGSRLWQPGSQDDSSRNWTIEPEGTWATEARV